MSDSTYDRLIRPIEAAMINALWRILRNGDDVDDALQDVLARVWTDLPAIERHANPRALIIRICTTTAIDHLRRRIRARRREEGETPKLPATAASASQSAENEETRHVILNAVAQIPHNQSVAVTMRLVDGESYETVAAALKCSEATARTHVKRGREKLRQLLQNLKPNAVSEVKQ